MDPLPPSNEAVKVLLAWAVDKNVHLISMDDITLIGSKNRVAHIPPKVCITYDFLNSV